MVLRGGEHGEVAVLGLEARFKAPAWEQEERCRLWFGRCSYSDLGVTVEAGGMAGYSELEPDVVEVGCGGSSGRPRLRMKRKTWP